MSRGKLYLIGAALLGIAAIGWLQKEASMPQESPPEENDTHSPAPQSDAATRTPPVKPREFTPPPRRPWRQPSKVPGPAQRLGVEPGESPGKADDGNPVPVAPRGEAGGQGPEGAQPGELNQPGTPPPADNRQSLLRNGGFEEGLEFWTIKQCQVIPEPGQKENFVLEVSLAGDGFLVEQVFQGRAETRDLTLSFRVKSPEALQKTPSAIPIDLFDAEGHLIYTSFLTVNASEEWTTFSGTLGLSEVHRVPASVRFRSWGDEGKLWIDDVTLK